MNLSNGTVRSRGRGFTKATVNAWRGALETRGLGSVSINVRITAVRKLAVEAADNGLLARVGRRHQSREGRKVEGHPRRELAVSPAGAGSAERARHSYQEGTAGPRYVGDSFRLRTAPFGGRCPYTGPYSATGQPLVHHRSHWKARPRADDSDADLGPADERSYWLRGAQTRKTSTV
jgi:hypothetical protein